MRAECSQCSSAKQQSAAGRAAFRARDPGELTPGITRHFWKCVDAVGDPGVSRRSHLVPGKKLHPCIVSKVDLSPSKVDSSHDQF